MKKLEQLTTDLYNIANWLDYLGHHEDKWPIDLLLEMERASAEIWRTTTALKHLNEALGG